MRRRRRRKRRGRGTKKNKKKKKRKKKKKKKKKKRRRKRRRRKRKSEFFIPLRRLATPTISPFFFPWKHAPRLGVAPSFARVGIPRTSRGNH